MTVHVEAILDFLIHDAVQDMGSEYWTPTPPSSDTNRWVNEVLPIAARLTRNTEGLTLLWNAGPITTRYSMEAQGVYAIASAKVEFVGPGRRRVLWARDIFEDSLLGIRPENTAPGAFHVPHHNVAGFRVGRDNLTAMPRIGSQDNMREFYFERFDDEKVPVHLIERVTVESKSCEYDATQLVWRGTLDLNVHIANTGEME